MPGFILHLQGPMQSYADTGFGQLREAGPFPSRAAVLGIIAAAMGIPRGDETLVKLHEAFEVHVATARPGQVFKDYHTVETDPARPKTLTWRDYHHDAHFVALVETEDRDLLEKAQAALRDPVYTAFLGRRSCPPATPLLPVPVEGDGLKNLKEAAEAAIRALPETGERRPERRARSIDVYLDGHFGKNEPEVTALLDGGGEPTYGARRDKLTASSRAYVNRPYTHLTVAAARQDNHSDEHQAYFDALSKLTSPASE